MRIRNLVLLLAVWCVFGVEGPQAEQAVLATAHDLGTTNGFLSTLTLSDRGVIAGWGGSDETFVLDTRTGASVTLPYFEPQGVNSRGQVVGIYDAPISFGGVQGTTWSERDQLQRMPDFVPFAINQHGQMAGNCILGPDVWGPACVAVTDRTGERTLQAIDVGPAAIESRAYDINDHGEVAGTLTYATGVTRAFRWSARDGLLLLEPGSSTQSSTAVAINNRGLVVGQASDQNTFVATEWTWSGEIAAQLTTNSTALDVNDQGIAVVTTLDPATAVFESKIWVPDAGVFELARLTDSTGPPLAFEINNRNQVVGQIDAGGGPGYHLVVWDVRIHGRP